MRNQTTLNDSCDRGENSQSWKNSDSFPDVKKMQLADELGNENGYDFIKISLYLEKFG